MTRLNVIAPAGPSACAGAPPWKGSTLVGVTPRLSSSRTAVARSGASIVAPFDPALY
jgi:hypothetical protein